MKHIRLMSTIMLLVLVLPIESKQLGGQSEEVIVIAQASDDTRSAVLSDYARTLRKHIRARIVFNPTLAPDNPEVVFKITQLTNGQIRRIELKKRSGNADWDDAVERAIRTSSPLPLASDGSVEEALTLSFRPHAKGAERLAEEVEKKRVAQEKAQAAAEEKKRKQAERAAQNREKNNSGLTGTSKPTVPLFVAACSTGRGPALYRLVSDPGANQLYFTSILNQQNINATKRGTNIKVTNDSYEFTLHTVDGEAKKASFYRKTGGLLIEAHPEMVRLFGFLPASYICQRLDDSEHEQTLALLKSGRQAGEEAEDERTRALKNRPNKF